VTAAPAMTVEEAFDTLISWVDQHEDEVRQVMAVLHTAVCRLSFYRDFEEVE